MDQNALRNYLNLYDQENLGAPRSSDPRGAGGSVPVIDWNRPNTRMDWALNRLREDQANQPPEWLMGGFGSSGGASYRDPNTTQGQMPNPYMRRALQLNRDLYSGAGMQPQIMNHLARFFEEGNTPQPRQPMRRTPQIGNMPSPWSQ